MSYVVTAVVSAVALSAYQADQQRKALHAQADAVRNAQAADAQQAAAAETQAAVAANTTLAEKQRRRRASALGMGDPAGTQTLGGAPSALATPSPAATRSATTVLGRGS